MVTEAAQHIITAGGKRFRPLLVVLGSLFGGDAVAEDVTRAAVVVELTHVGSLYHDDVMDEAGIRRGSVSANERWGNTVAILVGDFLFSRASDVVAELGPEFVKLQSRTFSRLVQGQIAETVGPIDGQDALDHYLKVVADKTGSLIATSALFGSKLAGAPLEVQQAMSEFGEQIGVVFQLSDDIIDITSDVTGKTPGTDLREGIRDPADAAGPQVHRPRRRPAAGAPRLRSARRRRSGRGARPAAPPPQHRPGAIRSRPTCRTRPRPPRPHARRPRP